MSTEYGNRGEGSPSISVASWQEILACDPAQCLQLFGGLGLHEGSAFPVARGLGLDVVGVPRVQPVVLSSRRMELVIGRYFPRHFGASWAFCWIGVCARAGRQAQCEEQGDTPYPEMVVNV